MAGPERGENRQRGPVAFATGLRGRWMILLVLGCGVIAKVADANPHPSYAYVPFVLGLYALPVWYASGRRRDVWARYGVVLVLFQAVATFLPFVIFGHGWVGGVSGLLGGLVLLVVPGRRGWMSFVGLAALEICCWLVVGLPYDPAAHAIGWLLIGFTYHGLTLYGLTRLADLNDRLDATRGALAEAAVTRLRLVATERIGAMILRRLDDLTALAENAVRAASTHDARRHLAAAGQVARQAGADARRLVVTMPAPEPEVTSDRDGTEPIAVTPLLARTVTAAVVAAFAGTYVLNVALLVGGPGHSWKVVVAAVGVAVIVTALQWRHVSFSGVAAPGPVSAPAGWPWTLAVQTGLCFVLYPAAGVQSMTLLVFPGATALLLIRHWSRWLCFGAVVVAIPVLTLLSPTGSLDLIWSIYAAAIAASACLVIYGLAQLTRVSALLNAVRRDLADGAAAGERLRLTRDAHDTLGLGLSTVALKTDLAAALLDRDPARARHEIAQLTYVADTVARDAAAVTTGHVRLDLEQELRGAAKTLRTAGIATTIHPQADKLALGLGPPARAAFAAVIREAVTNVLRHSQATTCTITLSTEDGIHTLVINNDGSGDRGLDGQGLTNMAQRIEALNGVVHTKADHGEFTLTVVVPLPAAAGHEPAAVNA